MQGNSLLLTIPHSNLCAQEKQNYQTNKTENRKQKDSHK